MEELKQFRISLGLSHGEFAKNLGVSLSLYQKVEGGFRKPSREFTEKLKIAYPQFDVNIFYSNLNHIS